MCQVHGVMVIMFFFRVHKDFSSVIKECYAPYSPAVEDKASFGKQNGTA